LGIAVGLGIGRDMEEKRKAKKAGKQLHSSTHNSKWLLSIFGIHDRGAPSHP
jgi:hypothetical protein